MINYIKYAFMASLLALGVAGISYVILNERQKSDSKLQNQSLSIQKQAFQQDLTQQREVIAIIEQHQQKRKQKANKLNFITQHQLNDKTIIQLQNMKNCELQHFTNLETLCQ